MMRHILTYKNPDGMRVRFVRELNDAEFDAIVSELGGHLPASFSAHHVGEGRTKENCPRVAALATFPRAVNYFGAWLDPVETLRLAKREADVLLRPSQRVVGMEVEDIAADCSAISPGGEVIR